MAVTCVPIPPLFFDLPLRQMMLPFIGRLPVNSQIRAIQIPVSFGTEENITLTARCKQFFPIFSPKTMVRQVALDDHRRTGSVLCALTTGSGRTLLTQ